MRNIQLPGIYAYPTLESQQERYLKYSWDHAFSITMDDFFENHVSSEEKDRYVMEEAFSVKGSCGEEQVLCSPHL